MRRPATGAVGQHPLKRYTLHGEHSTSKRVRVYNFGGVAP